jgi:hypothetical protein
MSKKALEVSLAGYLKTVKSSEKALRKMAREAEESDDYYDYDQACYDTWEYLYEEGKALAAAVEEFLKGEKA